tara:strand:+ start:118468 stop:118860 length:393 start_codon:yes stop_codon:yes gene_type:complete
MEVVCAIVINKDKKIFAARRKEDLDFGGYWEFPGGKLEEGEISAQALQRELQEELGLALEIGRELHRLSWKNKLGEFMLIAHLIHSELEDLALVDHDQSDWFSIDDIASLQLMVADMALLPKVEEYLMGA